MIHNPYTDAVGSITASEEFKRELTKKLLSQQAVPIKPEKKKRFKRAWAIAIAAVFALTIAAGGILWRSGILGQNRILLTSNTAALSKAPDGNLSMAPHFYINNRIYWPRGASLSKLPSNYKLVGKILPYGKGDFHSEGMATGRNVYMDKSNPYAAYVSDISTYTKGNKVYANNMYALYVTDELRHDFIYYNGRLFKYYANMGDFSKDFKCCVGTVKSIDYVRLPSHEFESNMVGSLGRKVYASKTDKNQVYVEMAGKNVYCLTCRQK